LQRIRANYHPTFCMLPLGWAETQTNLGDELATFGERQNDTAPIKEAVAKYREALKERTRERVPLYWAETQHSLGDALRLLGERESGTAIWKRRSPPMARLWRYGRVTGCPCNGRGAPAIRVSRVYCSPNGSGIQRGQGRPSSRLRLLW
jgi:hypothetical protein